jgi:hypothetical protein
MIARPVWEKRLPVRSRKSDRPSGLGKAIARFGLTLVASGQSSVEASLLPLFFSREAR